MFRKLGTSEQTYYRWRKEYGGLRVNHPKRLKALEVENPRLGTVVAESGPGVGSLERDSGENRLIQQPQNAELSHNEWTNHWGAGHYLLPATACSPARAPLRMLNSP